MTTVLDGPQNRPITAHSTQILLIKLSTVSIIYQWLHHVCGP